MTWEPSYNFDMSKYDGFFPWGDCVCCYFDCAMCGLYEVLRAWVYQFPPVF